MWEKMTPRDAGENIHEARSDANWECPACRAICNCSGGSIGKGTLWKDVKHGKKHGKQEAGLKSSGLG